VLPWWTPVCPAWAACPWTAGALIPDAGAHPGIQPQVNALSVKLAAIAADSMARIPDLTPTIMPVSEPGGKIPNRGLAADSVRCLRSGFPIAISCKSSPKVTVYGFCVQ